MQFTGDPSRFDQARMLAAAGAPLTLQLANGQVLGDLIDEANQRLGIGN